MAQGAALAFGPRRWRGLVTRWRVYCPLAPTDGVAGTFDTLEAALREVRDSETPFPQYGWPGCAGPHVVDEVEE
jgi:hypothetical protein